MRDNETKTSDRGFVGGIDAVEFQKMVSAVEKALAAQMDDAIDDGFEMGLRDRSKADRARDRSSDHCPGLSGARR